MRALGLSKLVQRDPNRPSLKERAAALKASAERAIRRKPAALSPVSADHADPVLAAIEAHRQAYQAWVPHLHAISGAHYGRPEHVAAEATGAPYQQRDSETFAALFSTVPTTLPGLLALAEYLPGAIARNGRDDPNDDGVKATDALGFALKHLVRQGRIMADSCPLPAPKPALDAPADLAEACDWAIRHWEWMNAAALDENWQDDRADRELDRYGAVFSRAESEPARDLRTLAAKARLARFDWLSARPADEEEGDGLKRMVLKILRDASALGEPARRAYGALPEPDAILVGLDLAALPMRELEALHAIAEPIGAMAGDLQGQPRCHAGEQGLVPVYNAAGRFAAWVKCLADLVVDRARQEARTRRPEGGHDAERRLAVIAKCTVTNGDPAELRALARDLQAQARRIESRG